MIDYDHLFEQADNLIQPSANQADLRRAISSAYYGVFHCIMTTAVDLFAGSVNRGTQQYTFTYRSVTHDWLRKLCDHFRGLLTPKGTSACASGVL
jgi:hypothetical protein